MSAEIYVADRSNDQERQNPPERSVWLNDDGYYWHLYRYFEGANLDRRHELIDLYGDATIEGYQLDRLEDELRAALTDAQTRPAQWSVLTGWREQRARENEIWQEVDREKMFELVGRLLWLIAFARDSGLPLVCFGD